MTPETPSKQFAVVVATDITDEGLSLLRGEDDLIVHTIAPTADALRDYLPTVHALIARDDVTIDRALLDAAPNLRVIGRVGASLNGIDIDAASVRGIVVMNTPGVSAIAAGEHTVTLILALARRLVEAHNSLGAGFWLLDRRRQAGTQLMGKTLGIIGYGRVGRVVAARCLAFGMQVLAADPYIREEQIEDRRIQLVGLKELLNKSDIVSLHVPATAETRTLIDARAIGLMKRGARLINTAFGGAVDADALHEALVSGQIGGAGLDVYAQEPPYNSPLIGMDNVIHTPHIAENTVEATQDLSLQIAAQVMDALRDEDYRNVVNLPFLPGVEYETTRPYLRLAERIGAILGVLARLPVRRIAVEYRGDDMEGLVKPLTVALLKGVLTPAFGESVNYINAPMLANERGIQVTRARGLHTAEYTSLVSCQFTLEDGETITIAGTLLDRREAHIVQINDYRMDFIPEGYLLILGSYDSPGVIGKVGTLLADNGVNIATWQTGRAGRGGSTLTVLTLDEPLTDGVLESLRGQAFVRHAHPIDLNG
ncbi:MAG: phosphoglycerate dehydrogenase [Chloroflexota bacterium]|nr:phosphoglycerate dehydrogenase [Chloroflexota bacterium]